MKKGAEIGLLYLKRNSFNSSSLFFYCKSTNTRLLTTIRNITDCSVVIFVMGYILLVLSRLISKKLFYILCKVFCKNLNGDLIALFGCKLGNKFHVEAISPVKQAILVRLIPRYFWDAVVCAVTDRESGVTSVVTVMSWKMTNIRTLAWSSCGILWRKSIRVRPYFHEANNCNTTTRAWCIKWGIHREEYCLSRIYIMPNYHLQQILVSDITNRSRFQLSFIYDELFLVIYIFII